MATGKLQPQLTVPSAERKQKAKAHYDKRSSKQLNEFAIGEKVLMKLKPEEQKQTLDIIVVRWLISLCQDRAL